MTQAHFLRYPPIPRMAQNARSSSLHVAVHLSLKIDFPAAFVWVAISSTSTSGSCMLVSMLLKMDFGTQVRKKQDYYHNEIIENHFDLPFFKTGNIVTRTTSPERIWEHPIEDQAWRAQACDLDWACSLEFSHRRAHPGKVSSGFAELLEIWVNTARLSHHWIALRHNSGRNQVGLPSAEGGASKKVLWDFTLRKTNQIKQTNRPPPSWPTPLFQNSDPKFERFVKKIMIDP